MLNSKTNNRKVKSRFLSGKKSKTLSEKLKSYSLFSTALIASAAAADGQVIYTNVDPDTTVNNGNYDLDLNNDGIVDYSISQSNFINPYAYCDAYGFSAVVYPAPGNSIVDTFENINNYFPSYVPKACHFGFEINSNLAWNNNWAGTLGYFGRTSCDEFFIHQGDFLGQTKYLALRFNIDGEQHYGWARLSVEGLAKFVTIHDYAYEATPNTPIVAGDVGVMATCEIPTGLTNVKIKATSAKLEWDAVAGAEGYTVRYKVANTGEWKYGTTYNNSKPISGLLPNTVYKWEVRAFCHIDPPRVMSDWSSIQEFTTGILRMGDESLQQLSFQIYPNPASGKIIVSFSSDEQGELQIRNLLGQIVFSKEINSTTETIDVSKFPDGVYLISAENSTQKFESKILKE